MKKETLITAVVFLGVGFLAGFAFSAHRSSLQRPLQRETPVASSASSQQPAGDSAPSGPSGQSSQPASPEPSSSQASSDSGEADLASKLPKGHPQLTDAEVIQFFKDASQHNPGNPAPRLKLADFLYDRKQYDQAISWYQQALALDPKNVDARTDMATCYFSLGRAREAASQLRAALEIDPRHEPTLFNLALVNMEGTHNYTGAREALNRLAAINPNYPGLADLKQQLDQTGSSGAGRKAN
ncbi:MAG: tetratricopeptide repeat protein [Terriglobia bacterium]